MLRIALTGLALALLYLVFAGQPSTSELLAGLPAWLLAMACARGIAHATNERPISLRAPWGRLASHLALTLVTDTASVARALLLGRGGTMLAQPFRPGASNATDAGRRALSTLALSLAPNGYVVAIGPDHIALHQLRAQPARPDQDWPL